MVINTWNERSLHASLKEWYAEPGDRFEVPVDGFVVDIVRGDLLIEIQTSSLGALKRKLHALMESHRVRLVHPIAVDKWIVRQNADDGRELGRRKSPKHGSVEQVFRELVSLPHLAKRAPLAVEVLLTREEEYRRHVPGKARRRKGWVVHERRLIDVIERVRLETPQHFGELLPSGLPAAFTTTDIAEAAGIGRPLAGKMAYCLREMGAVVQVGKQGNSLVYERTL